MAVAKDTLFENVFDVIFNAMNGIADPKARGQKWVFGSFPSSRSDTFPGYPIIVVSPAEIVEMRTMNFDRSKWRHDIILTVEVYDNQMERLDTLSSTVIKTLRNYNYRSQKLARFAITGGRSDMVEHEGKKIYYRTFIVGLEHAS